MRSFAAQMWSRSTSGSALSSTRPSHGYLRARVVAPSISVTSIDERADTTIGRSDIVWAQIGAIDEHVEVRFDDRAAARRGRTPWSPWPWRSRCHRRNASVHEAAVHARLEVQHATGGRLLENDVVEAQRLGHRAVTAMEPGVQERALLAWRACLPAQRPRSAACPAASRSVRKPRRPRLMPEERHVVAGDEARAVEQGAVTADGDEQVRLLGELLLRAGG